jgi:hypothetical protein
VLHAALVLGDQPFEESEDIADRGITGGPIEIVRDSGRKASFTDADGNAISFIEVSTRAR